MIHFPKAARIVVSFDPQTRTETNYDYFQFWKVRIGCCWSYCV